MSEGKWHTWSRRTYVRDRMRRPAEPKPVWNPLEVAKLAMGIMMPRAIAYIGHQFAQAAADASVESAKFLQDIQLQFTRQQDNFKKYREIWDNISGVVSQSFEYIEGIDEDDPPGILRYKVDMGTKMDDRMQHLAIGFDDKAFLFSPGFQSYMTRLYFIAKTCFAASRQIAVSQHVKCPKAAQFVTRYQREVDRELGVSPVPARVI